MLRKKEQCCIVRRGTNALLKKDTIFSWTLDFYLYCLKLKGLKGYMVVNEEAASKSKRLHVWYNLKAVDVQLGVVLRHRRLTSWTCKWDFERDSQQICGKFRKVADETFGQDETLRYTTTNYFFHNYLTISYHKI